MWSHTFFYTRYGLSFINASTRFPSIQTAIHFQLSSNFIRVTFYNSNKSNISQMSIPWCYPFVLNSTQLIPVDWQDTGRWCCSSSWSEICDMADCTVRLGKLLRSEHWLYKVSVRLLVPPTLHILFGYGHIRPGANLCLIISIDDTHFRLPMSVSDWECFEHSHVEITVFGGVFPL